MRKDKKKTRKNGRESNSKAFKRGLEYAGPDQTEKQVSSASEAALLKQAENPLGDPHNI